jgi:16S rRNA C1402 N4-methylase RsmH
LTGEGITEVRGVLADLGVSSHSSVVVNEV